MTLHFWVWECQSSDNTHIEETSSPCLPRLPRRPMIRILKKKENAQYDEWPEESSLKDTYADRVKLKVKNLCKRAPSF